MERDAAVLEALLAAAQTAPEREAACTHTAHTASWMDSDDRTGLFTAVRDGSLSRCAALLGVRLLGEGGEDEQPIVLDDLEEFVDVVIVQPITRGHNTQSF